MVQNIATVYGVDNGEGTVRETGLESESLTKGIDVIKSNFE